MLKSFSIFLALLLLLSCNSRNKSIPQIGFLDFQEDETLGQARVGFFDALKKNGFSEEQKTIGVIYKNAQGDQIALGQACDYLISENVTLIATNPTMPTIAAVQKTNEIPVFMMVSPEPKLMGVLDKNNNAPANLFGTYETLDYIDTAVKLIRQALPNAKIIGTIFNQSEPQSVNALYQVDKACSESGFTLIKLPVNNSNEAQLVMQSLLTKNIDAFFAMPDNTVFSSIEVLVKSCDDANVPVFTCEEGLVKRGAVAGFGADMYQWGYQAGEQASLFLKNKSTNALKPELVKMRRRVYNEEKAKKFNLNFSGDFIKVK